jgi:pseudaminic acid biosynthesis-associated methylase
MSFKTEQEAFWAGNFGNEYIERNQGEEILASNLNFFSKIFDKKCKPTSFLEFGANIGMNSIALKKLYPHSKVSGIEINKTAAEELAKIISKENVYNQTIFDFETNDSFEVTFIKGVLIHINPDMLQAVYEKLYNYSTKYILVAEYYNPNPVSIPYRGHSDRLFKRDFAGEILDKYNDLKLIDYGFCYKRDVSFPQDDITWFLMEKI